MQPRPHGIGHVVREFVTHWSVTGAILAATGAAPEHWVAEVIDDLHIPYEAFPPWIEQVDYRLVAVVAGLSIIVGDNLWRHHGRRAPLTTDVVAPLRGPETERGLPVPDNPSIAVMPFANLSDDPEQEYFSDGIADDLITTLCRFHPMFVVARDSSFAYKGQTIDVKDIGRALGVRYVLSGSARKSATRVRISVQLSDAVVGNHIWAERYDRDAADVFAVQDDITNLVTQAILPALDQAERDRVMRKPPQDLGAWEAYQRGLWHISRLVGSDNESARGFFQQAIKQDATFARAYSGLAYTYNRDVVQLRKTPSEALSVAEPLARMAVTLDDMDANAHAVLSMVLLFQKGDYNEATAEAQRALELNSNLGLAQSTMGMVLTFSGRPQEGLKYALEGLRLDPRNSLIMAPYHVAVGHYFSREYQGALEAIRLTLRSHGDYGHTYYWLAAILGQLENIADARQALEKAIALRAVPYGISATGQCLPWLRPEDYSHMTEGLRKAGWQG